MAAMLKTIFKLSFLHANYSSLIQYSPKFVIRNSHCSDNGLVPYRRQAIIWPKWWPLLLTQLCVTRPQWVKTWWYINRLYLNSAMSLCKSFSDFRVFTILNLPRAWYTHKAILWNQEKNSRFERPKVRLSPPINHCDTAAKQRPTCKTLHKIRSVVSEAGFKGRNKWLHPAGTVGVITCPCPCYMDSGTTLKNILTGLLLFFILLIL